MPHPVSDSAKKIIYLSDVCHNKKRRAFLADIDEAGEMVYIEELNSFRMLSAANDIRGIYRCRILVFDRGHDLLNITTDLSAADSN